MSEEKKLLKDYLETLSEDSVVAIGTDKGSSFLYIGRAGDVSLIEFIFDEYKTNIVNKLSRTKNTLEKTFLNPPKLDGETYEKNFEIIQQYASELTNYVGTINHCNKYVKTYKPVLERKIEEHYHKEVDDCECIILEGLEVGQFWFKDEFDRRYN